ncbi:hypothetical protein WIV_gp070 [Wiseana iridescent virus]|uniref:Uncharacterized protein n=1 Tax=Wiseana iridescent virus TaxID=68347 RepID=G0T596_IRV9|nr:hypothetical protein WIV_gp070 [Wiseana iridescent virus]ADO00413.1 hypothetical protein [Wiseana iridescent virus]
MLQLQELSDALDEIEVEPRRHDSKLLKILKDLDTDYQKKRLENVDKDERDLLKLYFSRIINGSNLTVREITPILDEYIEESNVQPFADIINGIKVDLISKKLNLDDFFDFIEKFVAQKYPINIFYKRYFPTQGILKPSLTDIFGDELDDLSSDSESSDDDTTEEEKLQKIRDKIEEKREEPQMVQIIEPRPERKRGKVAVIQDNVPIPQVPVPKPVADKIFFETMVDVTKQDCEFLYKKIPWVKDIVNHIYIHPIEGNFDGIIDSNRFIEHNKVKFYQPKEKYYLLGCHSHKIQEGNILTIIKGGETYKLMVAIDTNTKGIVLQNEDMLKAEIDYIRVWNQNKSEHIRELRRNEPNDEMIRSAKFYLSSSLQDAIGGNVPVAYRSVSSQFIETVIQTILKNSNSGDSFIRLLSSLIIFLKINLSFITSSVFIKRLREQIYLPGTLPFLTDADKLPEIFLVGGVPDETKNFVLEKLEEERLYFTKTFLESLHGSSVLRNPTRPMLWKIKPTQQIELPDIKSICKNKDEVMSENDEDIVFYNDLNEVYCFNVFKLYNLFKQEDLPINPYTNRPFSDKFIQIFLTRYASKPLIKKIEHTQHSDLTTKLEQLIEQELSLLENYLIETENPDFIQRYKSSISPQFDEPVVKTRTRVSRVKENFEDKEEPDKCFECKGELGSDKIGSVFRNKQIAFCGYSCLEKNKSFK